MNTRYMTCFATVAVLAGCALETPREDPTPVWEAAQVAPRNRTFVFCEGQDCHSRTPKIVTQAQPAKKDAVENKPTPAPLKDAHFVVHFPWGSSQLDAPARKELAAITNSETFKKAAAILVAGRTDPSGKHAFNEKLAIRRAKTVKAGLIAAGAKAESVQAIAQDPCCSGKTPDDRRPARALRRTDVDITLKTPRP